MVSTKEQRKAAMAAARKKNTGSTTNEAKTKTTNVNIFGMTAFNAPNEADEERLDEGVNSGRNTSQERTQPTKKEESRQRDFRQGRSRRSQAKEIPTQSPVTSKEDGTHGDATSTKDSIQLFGRGDKRQKKVVYNKFSDDPKETLELVAGDIPEPIGDEDVVVKTMASTVSYGDCLTRRGICFDVINPTDLPATPGMDIVGNIVSVGSKVQKFSVGDRVAAIVRTGGNARYVCVPEVDLVQVPRSCDSAEAVCMVTTFMTAYQSLRMITKDNFTLNGKRVLITGGIEPVGQALIQLCFRAGAEEIFATAPDHRHRYIKTVLGAKPLPVNPDEWLPAIRGSMDIVFDSTCDDNLASPSASLKNGGAIVCLGMSSLLNREKAGVFGAPLSAYWAKLKGQFMTNTRSYEVWDSFTSNKDAYKLDLEILFHLLKKRFIKPHIAKRIALSEVAEAQANLETESARGEIVCLPWKRLVK